MSKMVVFLLFSLFILILFLLIDPTYSMGLCAQGQFGPEMVTCVATAYGYSSAPQEPTARLEAISSSVPCSEKPEGKQRQKRGGDRAIVS